LIVDAGHTSDQTLGRLAHRVAIPDDWRIVLVLPAHLRGLSGANEADAFAHLPSVPNAVTRQLWQITKQELLPALERADCAAFGDAVYRFGRVAGECFAAVQGGPFFHPEIARLVDAIRDFGVTGVGQSSWGPAVFAICATQQEADRLIQASMLRPEFRGCDMQIASPCNTGARIETSRN
jgi:predicted sugar kinase